jgi:hypothetical protein
MIYYSYNFYINQGGQVPQKPKLILELEITVGGVRRGNPGFFERDFPS